MDRMTVHHDKWEEVRDAPTRTLYQKRYRLHLPDGGMTFAETTAELESLIEAHYG